jgi:long-chain acyl-CoA synthetase
LRSYADIDAELTLAGGEFEIETVEIGGRPTRVWKHASPSLVEVLRLGRSRGGDADFIVHGDERISHEAHYQSVAAFAQVLQGQLGVRKGDRIAIAMRNYPEWSVAFFAALAVGGIAVALNAWWTGEELAFGLEDSGARVLIADAERLARLAPHLGRFGDLTTIAVRTDTVPQGAQSFEALMAGSAPGDLPDVPIEPEDPATIFYTSGTTSHPKGVLASHRNICSNMVTLQFTLARTALRAGRQPAAPPPGVRLLCVPLFHASGSQSVLQTSVLLGGKLVFMNKWDPVAALELMAQEGVNQLSCVPTMVWDVLNTPRLADYDLSALLSIGMGGAAAPPELVRRVDQLLPGRNLANGYGLTETSSQTTGIGGLDFRAKPDSVGLPVPVCDIRIVDESGGEVPTGEAGEIRIRGPNVVGGYWNRPEASAESFVDGWLHSGDIGRVDDEGFLYIVDRAKDIIIRGGENVSSAEVEAALFEHPAVAEAAAIGVPHPTWGEAVGAVVRLHNGQEVTAAALRDHVRERLAGFKVPQHIWFESDPFPRNASGKIQKRDLKEIVSARASAP